MFSKGNIFPNFLFAYLEDKVFPKWGLLLTNYFRWEAKENKRVASPESVPIPLKVLIPFETGGKKGKGRVATLESST